MNTPLWSAGEDNDPEDQRVRRLLLDATPQLLDPPNRIDAVAVRVRRVRRRRVGSVTLAVAVLAVLAVAVFGQTVPGPTPASALGADGCPVMGTTPEPVARTSRAGDLVPVGAADIVLCERVNTFVSRHPQLGNARVLTTRVAELVSILNALPDRATVEERMRQNAQAHGDTPVVVSADSCPAVLPAAELTFVLRYPDRPPAVVWLSCAAATYNGRSRYDYTSALTAFYERYRAQLAASVTPATLRNPICQSTMDTRQFDRRSPDGEGLDEIARNRGVLEPLLPSAVAVATACRYAVGADGAHLLTSRPVDPTSLATVRAAVNAQFDSDAVLGTDCGEPISTTPPTLMDELFIVDITGARIEIRAVRAPCTAALAAGQGALNVLPSFIAVLDSTLGPS